MMSIFRLLNPFAIHRHHLQNEMARRVIAANPTPAERARAAEKARGRLGGAPCKTKQEWDEFVTAWLPILYHKRLSHAQIIMRVIDLHGGTATDAQADQLRQLERPITWQEITAYVRSVEKKSTKRPPQRLVEQLNHACYMDGRPTPVPLATTGSGNP